MGAPCPAIQYRGGAAGLLSDSKARKTRRVGATVVRPGPQSEMGIEVRGLQDQALRAGPGRQPTQPSAAPMTRLFRKPSALRRASLIAAHRRTASTDRALAIILAGVAGCANAGGFILLGRYTSHMTGYLSQVADNLVLHNVQLLGQGVLAIGLFVTGAASSSFAINWARRRMRRHQYALTIGIQGMLFLILAGLGLSDMDGGLERLSGLALLCFIMGFQNATITKISGARIRTTHATGMITDIGIECGRAAYGWRYPGEGTRANTANLRLLLILIGMFLIGGVVGAVGYGLVGYAFSLLLATLLFGLAMLSGMRRSFP